MPFASTLNLAGVLLSMGPGVRALGGGGPAEGADTSPYHRRQNQRHHFVLGNVEALQLTRFIKGNCDYALWLSLIHI